MSKALVGFQWWLSLRVVSFVFVKIQFQMISLSPERQIDSLLSYLKLGRWIKLIVIRVPFHLYTGHRVNQDLTSGSFNSEDVRCWSQCKLLLPKSAWGKFIWWFRLLVFNKELGLRTGYWKFNPLQYYVLNDLILSFMILVMLHFLCIITTCESNKMYSNFHTLDLWKTQTQKRDLSLYFFHTDEHEMRTDTTNYADVMTPFTAKQPTQPVCWEIWQTLQPWLPWAVKL